MSMIIRERLFAPGPTPVLKNEVISSERSLYHRSPGFQKLFHETRQRLAPFFGSKTLPLILASSGTGAMEAVVSSLVAPEECCAVISCGRFGERWPEILTQLGSTDLHHLKAPWGEAPDLEAIEGFLKAHGTRLKAVFFQIVETSTGVRLPVERLANLVRHYSDALICVDGLSALSVEPVHMEQWGFDALVGGSQKGFGIGAGLSFVALSERAVERVSKQTPRSFYFDLKKEHALQQTEGLTAWTGATTLVQDLSLALQSYHEVGLERLFAHYEGIAKALRGALGTLGLNMLSKDPALWARGVSVFMLPQGLLGSECSRYLHQTYGAQFVGGSGPLKGKVIRMGHMGPIDWGHVVLGISALELGLARFGALETERMGSGVGCFLREYSKVAILISEK